MVQGITLVNHSTVKQSVLYCPLIPVTQVKFKDLGVVRVKVVHGCNADTYTRAKGRVQYKQMFVHSSGVVLYYGTI